MAHNESFLPATGIIVHNNLLGLNEGDYIHLTAAEKAEFDTFQSQLDGKVQDSIVDGVLTIAPSQNAVHDALILKEDASNKTSSLIPDMTFIKYPTVNAVLTGDMNTLNDAKAYTDTAVAAATIPDATTTLKGKLKLAGDLSGTADTPTVPGLLLKEDLANKGVANGYASLDSAGRIPTSQLPNSVMEYKGVYDAAANVPPLSNGAGNNGDVYRCTVAGPGVNSLNFVVGDYAIYNGTVWEKQHSGADTVVAVFGRAGAVVAAIGDYDTSLVPDTLNKRYQTDNQQLFNDATSSIQTQLNARELLSNKQNNLNYDGTGTKYPTVDAIDILEKKIATVATKTGLLSKNDTFNLIPLDNFTLRIAPVTSGMFWNELTNVGVSTSAAIKSFAQLDYPLTQLVTATGGNSNANPLTTDGKYVRYIGYDKNGNVFSSLTSFITNNDVLQLGFVTVLKSGATVSFLDGTAGPRNVFAQPNMASNTDFDKVTPITTNVTISGISGTASFATSNGNIIGICVNWKSSVNLTNSNPIDIFNYTGVTPAAFRSINPLFLNGTAALGTHTLWTETEDGVAINAKFFNTTTQATGTMANGSASLKRVLIGLRGSIYVQDAEFATTACFPDLATAKNNIYSYKFSEAIIPPGVAFEIARIAYIKGATDFGNTNQYYIVNTAASSSGGSSTIPPVSDATTVAKGIVKLAGDFDSTSTADIPIIGTLSKATSVTTVADMTINGVTIGRGTAGLAQNTVLGTSALLSNTTGNWGTAIGRLSLTSNTTGTNGTAVGYAALQSNTIGVNNTGIGFSALQSVVGSGNSTALGYQAGRYIADGTTALTTTNGSLYLGGDSKASADSVNNEIVIGQNAIGKGSNTATIGNTSTTDTYLLGKNLNLRNIAGTFYGNISNSITATRTWTMPDKTGTVAMTSDLTSVINPGTINSIPKYTGSTTISNSRLIDDGTYLGIGSISPIALSKDIQLGRQRNKEVGIEQSNSYNVGNDLIISAGRTINFIEAGSNFQATPQNLALEVSALASDGSMWGLDHGGNLYKKNSGTTLFVAVSGTTAPLYNSKGNAMAFTASGDLYNVINGTLYLRAGNTGAWVNQGISCVCVTTDGNDVYITVNGDSIYKKTNNTGAFVSIGSTPQTYNPAIVVHPTTKDIFIGVGSNILKWQGGVGPYVTHLAGQIFAGIFRITASNDLWIGSYGDGSVQVQTNMTGSLTSYGVLTVAGGQNICNDDKGNILSFHVGNNAIYFKQNEALGGADLQGGFLKLKAGTGKGQGQSRVQVITGTKTVSGTNMQIEQVVAEFNENGDTTFLGKIIKTGGTGSQFLMADGTTTTAVKPRKDVTGTTYTLLSGDNLFTLYFTNTSGCTVTVPSGLTASQEYECIQYTAGTVSFVTSGTTFRFQDYEIASMYGQYSRASISWIDTETYQLIGQLSMI